MTLWTVAHQASLSMGFTRQEDWSELPFPNPGIEPAPPALAGGFFTTQPQGDPSTPVRQVQLLSYLPDEVSKSWSANVPTS